MNEHRPFKPCEITLHVMSAAPITMHLPAETVEAPTA